MGSVIVLTTIFSVFFIRDLQLLTAGSVPRIGTRLAAYCISGLTYIIVFGYLLPSFESHPFLFFRRPPLWIAAVLVHVAIWGTCIWLKKSNRLEAEWLTTLFPAPVFLISVVTFGASLRAVFPGLNSVVSATTIMALWWAMICCAALFLSRSPSRGSDAEFALEFAGFANMIVLMLVPLHNLLPGTIILVE